MNRNQLCLEVIISKFKSYLSYSDTNQSRVSDFYDSLMAHNPQSSLVDNQAHFS